MSEGVVPTLRELIALRALVQGRRGARQGRYGVHGHALSNQRGRGMEYAESREYAVGDDARHIDWRVTARSGKAHTKLFQAERERLTLVVADTAPTLYFGTRARFKSVQAARAGALAAWLAARDGDRIAALRGARREPPVPAASGPRGALRVLDALARWYARPPEDDAGLQVAIDHARRLLRPGSRLVVLADPQSLDGLPDTTWTALSLHADVTVLLLVDALEMCPPEVTLPFRPVDGARIELGLDATGVRKRWQQAFGGRLQATVDALQRQRVRAIVLQGDAPSDGWLPALDMPVPARGAA